MMRKWLIIIFLIVISTMAVYIVMLNQGKDSSSSAYKYFSQNEALTAGLETISGLEVDSKALNDWILASIKDKNKEYYVVAVPYMEYGMKKHFSFIALVDREMNKYAFYKMTADVGLNSPGEIPDEKNANSMSFYFEDVAGYYIGVGKIYQKGYLAYADGVLLELNKDNIFISLKKGSKPIITVSRPEN